MSSTLADDWHNTASASTVITMTLHAHKVLKELEQLRGRVRTRVIICHKRVDPCSVSGPVRQHVQSRLHMSTNKPSVPMVTLEPRTALLSKGASHIAVCNLWEEVLEHARGRSPQRSPRSATARGCRRSSLEPQGARRRRARGAARWAAVRARCCARGGQTGHRDAL
ncbi:hypothetical protein PHLGIDRAFT_170355 [Phlebiopsis gigantea 11061_1 CR5-6]|uniref:Uncharacterized protein n=1 Tax=Phlebiopsis gigantea (strain 11061_1 CR5-6) TaxID=745531 RepID=A0A0C3PGV6_PHLG1|nr:hypothetical protein PHLGIDRAFT_170355 [Phlebiopsis gigantea 11061_1 CR5-6]